MRTRPASACEANYGNDDTLGMSKSLDSVVSIDNVTKSYPTKSGTFPALAEVSLEIHSGEFVCLVGPSGCGKSTLLNMLAGFDFPSSGHVRSMGEVITGPSSSRVMCFQDAMQALLPWRSSEKNITFALDIRGGKSRRDRRQHAREFLSLVGLEEHAGSIPPRLSGGQRQKLQLARALAAEPEVLLMDEPFGALDAITRERMQIDLLDVWSTTGKTIVFVTHDVSEAVLLADRIAVMTAGPNARIGSLVTVELPRPRQRSETGFGKTVGIITDSLLGRHSGA